VNREKARRLGLRDSPLWREPERDHLSAPTELHLSITNACPLRCRHCFVSAGPRAPDEMSDDAIHAVLEAAARAGVFHIAFGGGEPFAHPRLLDFARRTLELGMVPNVTTSGALMTPEVARACGLFGRIHVSVDGVGGMYQAVRGVDGFPGADRALRMLLRAGAHVGINCVVSRRNIDHVPAVLRYARSVGVRDVLLLRWKPAGRALGAHEAMCPTPAQHLRLVKRVKWEILRGTRVRFDCSFVPILIAAGAQPRLLERLAVNGCEGGLTLAAVWPNGGLSACSFAPAGCHPASAMESSWETAPHFERFRAWPKRAAEPCRSCRCLHVCRGGCHMVAQAVVGDFDAPDPGCPIVAARA